MSSGGHEAGGWVAGEGREIKWTVMGTVSKSNTRDTSDRQGGVHVGFPKPVDTNLNRIS